MKKQLFSFVMLSLAVFTYIASSSPKEAQAPMQAINFDYAVASQEKPGSAGMLIALVNPSYAPKFESKSVDLFARFRNSMAADIDEVLVAKGFRLKGPFEAKDELIFNDKKETDILIEVEINPEFTNAQGGWKEQFRLSSSTPASYKYSGTCSLVGKINLKGQEPLTGEIIWSKSVTIPTVDNIQIQTQNAYKTTTGVNVMDDPGVHNSVGIALQAVYKGILDKIAVHFDPEEFRSLKPQIKELKSKKGY